MRWLTLNGNVKCGHVGSAALVAQQHWLRVLGSPAITESDPVGWAISGCPNLATNLKPCTVTGAVMTGYSGYVRVDGRRMTLQTLVGGTDSVTPSTYRVADPGQTLVDES